MFDPGGSRVSKGAARKRPSEADLSNGVVREKKKRKQKPRLPKNFDPENPGPKPDPERWLPKWQRSDFKKKRNRRREKASSILEQSLVKLLLETRICLNMVSTQSYDATFADALGGLMSESKLCLFGR